MIEWILYRNKQQSFRSVILLVVSLLGFYSLFHIDYKKMFFLSFFTGKLQIPLYFSFLFYGLIIAFPLISLLIAYDNHSVINRFYLSVLSRKKFVAGVFASNALIILSYILIIAIMPFIYHFSLEPLVLVSLFFLFFYGLFFVSIFTMISFLFRNHALIVSLIFLGAMIIPSSLSLLYHISFDIDFHLFFSGIVFFCFSILCFLLAWFYMEVADF